MNTSTIEGKNQVLPILDEEISTRARELWMQAGTPEGRDLEFWFAAENELNLERQAIAQALKFSQKEDHTEAKIVDIKPSKASASTATKSRASGTRTRT